MVESVVVKASTLEEAIEQALVELSLKKRKEMDIELLTELYVPGQPVELKAFRRQQTDDLANCEGVALMIHGDVDRSTGNISSSGDLHITGNVQPSLFIESVGSIEIGGTVQKAIVEGERKVQIRGNVLSSAIHVGVRDALENELSLRLEGVVHYLERIDRAISEILVVRDRSPEEIDAAELNRLFHWILEEKFIPFQRMKQEFIQKVKKHTSQLSDDWEVLANHLYNVLSDTVKSGVRNAQEFSRLVIEARQMHDRHAEDGKLDSLLELPYALNSVLTCNGTIMVTDRGLCNCSVSARRDVYVEGICRGGEMYADQKISVLESGSATGGKTVLKTSESGTITIGLARTGTELWVGTECHLVEKDQIGIFARMVDGKLIV
ncbi:hypothetical protein NCCP2222_08330 [Sporosarcina sp. NCCP-2222]|uniref:FapA family protein n=1 Tax=Sporosarcina sp. NCCP-2222 TaxID=2935073 RepID=UPI002084E065|nr:FapA family protein [Sporosarcina sp. NCCP-2222]GKV54886.1 hypothetical protein NCCP2222_08330 [Sporosarcina sp. NCCP-2222]